MSVFRSLLKNQSYFRFVIYMIALQIFRNDSVENFFQKSHIFVMTESNSQFINSISTISPSTSELISLTRLVIRAAAELSACA